MRYNDQIFEEIKKLEEETEPIELRFINRDIFYHQEQEQEKVLDLLKDGDIIGLVTSIEGLDVTHVGIVVEEMGKKGFLHAKYDGVKVELDLSKYLQSEYHRSLEGITVARLQDKLSA